MDKVEEGTIYQLGGVGALVVEALEKGKRARDPWGDGPGHADQVLDWERIMANTRNKALAMHVTDQLGNFVTPRSLGVTLLDFTEWALHHVLVEDDVQDVGDWGRL